MKINVLKGKLRECGLTQDKAAEEIGISKARFNYKINERDGAVFDIHEAQKLAQLLQLSNEEAASIFLC